MHKSRFEETFENAQMQAACLPRKATWLDERLQSRSHGWMDKPIHFSLNSGPHNKVYFLLGLANISERTFLVRMEKCNSSGRKSITLVLNTRSTFWKK